ncbi:MAG: hypothetical protein HOW71_36100 [Nonomuraea sp.]|nr:hypothetical protein [Nonomuraea sp.]NUP67594.1 hypothetical protein [Nonomuraea sp.]NUT45632.1 hypothetical protein [Thermoactinospora sp.]
MRIDPGALLAAGVRCEEAAAALRAQLPAFREFAAPTDDCFGLVERGADELAESYQAFYDELLAFSGDLTAKLTETATGLRQSAQHLGAG